jgi:hypothetical protein
MRPRTSSTSPLGEEYVAHVPHRLGEQEQEDDDDDSSSDSNADADNHDVQAMRNAGSLSLSDRKVRIAAPWKAPTVSHGARSQQCAHRSNHCGQNVKRIG